MKFAYKECVSDESEFWKGNRPMGVNQAEVVIIGGGIVGSAIAYFLSKQGLDVTVLEKGELASGTSSRCDGNILAIDKDPGFDSQMSLVNQQIFADARIDRSPCGTGTFARMAVLHARGEIKIGQNFVGHISFSSIRLTRSEKASFWVNRSRRTKEEEA